MSLMFNLEQQGRNTTPMQIMFRHALELDYGHFAGQNRDTDVDGADVVAKMFEGEPVSSSTSAFKNEVVFHLEGLFVRIWWYTYSPEVGWDVVGADADAVNRLSDAISELVPPISHDEENIVPVKFWALDAQGHPESRTRKIAVNPWTVIEGNYPADVRAHLQELINLREPQTGGKLILWHGLPGTGKTHFLRSLAYAWRDWCDVSYVVDPDQMFERAYYLMSTVLSAELETRWHLVVLEDSGEFMLSDAHARTGQGLSRLLNLTDGLVGQGLKLLVLMTTNEKITQLHPAVARPGRCLAEIGFSLFTHKEALQWATAHNITLDTSDEIGLADLYELIANAHIHNEAAPVSIGQYA